MPCEQLLPLEHPGAEPLRQCGVEIGGLSSWEGPFLWDESLPRYHRLVYCVTGRARLIFSEGSVSMEERQLWVFPAGHPFRWELEFDQFWQIAWFALHDGGHWQHLRSESPHTRYAGQSHRVPMLMQGLIDEAHSPQPDAPEVARLYAGILAAYLGRRLSPRHDASDTRQQIHLADLWTRIQANPAYNWTVGEMAQSVHLSEPQFFRIVQKFHHQTPGEMLLRLRMDRAKLLLRNSDITIEALAGEVGYVSPYAFAKAFKRYTGSAPGRFRRETSRLV